MRIRRVAHIPIAFVVGMFLGVILTLQVQGGHDSTLEEQLDVIRVPQQEISKPEQLDDIIENLESGDTVWIYAQRSGKPFSAIYQVAKEQ